MRLVASKPTSASNNLARTGFLLFLEMRLKVMATEASPTEFTLLTLVLLLRNGSFLLGKRPFQMLHANSIALLPLKEPFCIVTAAASNSLGTVSIEVPDAGTIHLTSFFVGFNVMTIYALIAILASSIVKEENANSDFIGELLDVQGSLVLLQSFNVKHHIAVFTYNMAFTHVRCERFFARERLRTLATTDEL